MALVQKTSRFLLLLSSPQCCYNFHDSFSGKPRGPPFIFLYIYKYYNLIGQSVSSTFLCSFGFMGFTSIMSSQGLKVHNMLLQGLSEQKCQNGDDDLQKRAKGSIVILKDYFSYNPKLAPTSDSFQYSIDQSNLMNILRQFFSKNQESNTAHTINKLLSKLRLDTDDELPQHYHEIVMEMSGKPLNPRLLFKGLLMKISKMKSEAGVIKLFAILFNLLRKTNYPEYYRQQLECSGQLPYPQEEVLNKHKWFRELVSGCMAYLGRVTSIADIYDRALTFRTALIGPQTMQTDLFRLVNVYSMLVPMLSQSTNTIGRYFREEIEYYSDFYKIMRSELLLGYYYMRHICSHFLTAYQTIPLQILQFFNEIVPEVELLCDQLEDFFLNKYYKCSQMGRRLYFKEEQLQELRYYIGQSKIEKMRIESEKKAEEMLRTNDSDFFQFKGFKPILPQNM